MLGVMPALPVYWLVALRQQLPWRQGQVGLLSPLGCHHIRVHCQQRAAARAARLIAAADRAAAAVMHPIVDCCEPYVIMAAAPFCAARPSCARRGGARPPHLTFGSQRQPLRQCRVVQARCQLCKKIWHCVLEPGLGCSTSRSQPAGPPTAAVPQLARPYRFAASRPCADWRIQGSLCCSLCGSQVWSSRCDRRLPSTRLACESLARGRLAAVRH